MKLPNWISQGVAHKSAQLAPMPETRLRVTNATRQTVLATCLEIADTGSKRNRGLLGRKGLAPGQGLWIVPCESVHTVGMQFAIDLVYLDRGHRIRKIRKSVPPWRISACLSAQSILELPSGTIDVTQSMPGDMIEFSEAPFTDDQKAGAAVSAGSRD